MNGRATQLLLWPRALVVGVLATGLGALGHVAAGGLLPGPTSMTFLTGASVALAAPLLLQQASALRLVLMLVAGQTAVHLGLTLAAGSGATHAAAHGPGQHASSGGGASLADAAASHVLGHGPMMLAHLAAAVAVGLWLGHGERLLWTLVRLCRHRLRVVTRLVLEPTPAPTPPRPTAHRYPRVRVALRQSRPSVRRGPPLVA
ncbi:hypothetical protein KDN32_03350 [Nocardioides sp. J2M5]|uniref:hypothetical protein n=1 Tax=Nocardioides palaemonis TaxID=2829810 RepID=UPI001BAC0BE6|nr:hypothetical protein [Nocardioides palaemonis]MBS2936776.1 hypothetical protein [Nocardioides palaemonis]